MVGNPSAATGPRRVLLGELLVQANAITPEQLAEVLDAPREPGKKLGQLLLERGWVTEPQLTQTLSLQLSVPWVSLYHIDFSRQLLGRVSRELAERHCLIPIFVRHVKGQGETLYVAMDDPTQDVALAEVARQAALPTRPMIASASDIRSAIRVYYGAETRPPPPEGIASAVARETIPQRPPPAPSGLREGRSATRAAEAPRPPPRPPTSTTGGAEASRAPGAAAPPRRTRRASRPSPSEVDATAPREAASSAHDVGRDGPPSGPELREDARSSGPDLEPRSSRPDVDREPRSSRSDDLDGGKRRGKMVSLTLLDGTTIQLPARNRRAGVLAAENLTARDLVSALRAASHGADAREILGEEPRWEPIVAALLSLMLRKGIIADWEFIEELRKL